MIQLSPHAQELERLEREAERERLLKRALEYTEEKQREERDRVRRAVLRIEVDQSIHLRGSTPRRRAHKRESSTKQKTPGGTKELLSKDVGTGGGCLAQHTPKTEFSQ